MNDPDKRKKDGVNGAIREMMQRIFFKLEGQNLLLQYGLVIDKRMQIRYNEHST